MKTVVIGITDNDAKRSYPLNPCRVISLIGDEDPMRSAAMLQIEGHNLLFTAYAVKELTRPMNRKTVRKWADNRFYNWSPR